MRQLLYFVKEALRGFFQAKLMTFVSILTVAATLFFLGIAALVFLNLHEWLREASDQAGIILYLDDSTAGDSLARGRLISAVESFPQTATVAYMSKADARTRFEEMYGLEMLQAVEENPLPASFELTLAENYRSAEAVAALKEELAGLSGVDDVRYSQEWHSFLRRARGYFLAAALLVILVLVPGLHFMISNTIKLTIYARRDLVTNMHFVGATESYIKAPFILEGILQGMVGGGMAALGLAVLRFALARISVYWGPWYLVLLCVSLAGIIFGWVGSWSAVRKFLV